MLSDLIHLAYLEIVAFGALLLCRFAIAPRAMRELGNGPAAIVLGLPALGLLLPKLVLFHAACLLLIPVLAGRSRGRVAPLYLLALMLLPSLDSTLMIGSLQLWSHSIHITIGLGALGALWSSPGRPRRRWTYDLPFAGIFLVLVFISVRDTSFTHFLRETAQAALTSLLPYYVVSRSVRSFSDVRRVMLALTLGGTVLAGILIFESIRTWPVYRQMYVHFGLPLDTIGVKFRAGTMRASGPFLESTSAAFFFLFCFLAVCLLRSAFRTVAYHRLFIILFAIGLFMPQSRGAWIGATLGIILADLYRRNFAGLVRKLAIIAIAVALLLPALATSGRLQQMVGTSGDAAGTVDYRQDLWDRGKQEVLSHPLIGQPQQQFKAAMQDLKQGEQIIDFVNTYLFMALAAGIPGALLFGGGIATSAARLWNRRKRLSNEAAAWTFVGLAVPLEMLAFTAFGGLGAILVYSFMGLGCAILQIRVPSGQRNKPALSRNSPSFRPEIVSTRPGPVVE